MNSEYKIFQTYFILKEDMLYFNQIKEYANISNSSLQNAIKKLSKADIIEIKKTKSNTFYKIKNKKRFALKFAEIAIDKFESLNINVKVPLRNFLKNMPREIHTIVLFGSAASKQEKKGSDIDLLIVSDSKVDIRENKRKAELTSKYPLSIFNATVKQFIENKDDIIVQARKTGFSIYREQNYYEEIINEY